MLTFHHTLNSFAREISSYFDEIFKSTGLSTSYIELLMFLHDMDGSSQKELAEILHLAPSTITRFIEKLEKKKLVKKSRSGREIEIELSPQGEAVVNDAIQKYHTAETELKDKLGLQYVETTSKLLDHGLELMKK